MQAIKALTVALAVLLVAGCDDEPDDKPYLEFAGGGFIFNFRLATADYGFVARVARDIPAGAIIEARFENPSGGEPIVIKQSAEARLRTYVFRTPPVQGVKAERDYRVELRLLDATGQQVIASYTNSFRSDIDQDVLPKAPLTVGPGYHQPKAEGARSKLEESY